MTTTVVLKRRPLKTLPWEKMSQQLKDAMQAWIDSGGDPALLDKVEVLTKKVQQASKKELPPRKRVKSKKGLGGRHFREELLSWLREAMPNPRFPMLPGERDKFSYTELGMRSRVQRAARTGEWTVVFTNGFVKKPVKVKASAERMAERAAWKKTGYSKRLWKIVRTVPPVKKVK